MAGKGISINFLADVRQFLRGTDSVEDALEDVADSLDDAAREGEDATEKLERSFRDLTQVAKRESSEAGDALSKKMKAGASDASDALQQVEDDGFSNAKEVAASFDGSAQSIVDGFQGAAAEAFSGFGPAGAVAGLVAAAGIGLVTAEIQKQEEATQRLKQYFAEAYQAAAAEGRAYIDQATIQAEAQDILFNPERKDELNQARRDALELGLSEQTLLLAMAGDQQALNDVLALSAQKYGDASQAVRDYTAQSGLAVQADSVLVAEQGEADRLLGRYEKVRDAIEENVAKQETAAGIITDLAVAEREQIRKTRDASQARYEAEAAALGKLPPRVVVPVELQVPDLEAMVANLQRRAAVTRIRFPAAVFTDNGTQVY